MHFFFTRNKLLKKYENIYWNIIVATKQWGWGPPSFGPQPLKLNLVPRTQILFQFGPPKKRVNFDICNRRHKWVYCVYWQCHFDTLSFPEQIQFCTPLGAYWIVLSPTLFGQLDTLALKANKFSGPPAFWSPQLALVPRTCAPCA